MPLTFPWLHFLVSALLLRKAFPFSLTHSSIWTYTHTLLLFPMSSEQVCQPQDSWHTIIWSSAGYLLQCTGFSQQSCEVVEFSSVSQSCPTLCDPMNCSTPGLPVHHELPESSKPMSIESVMPSNHLILCCPLLLLPSIFPSIRVFSNESTLRISWPKYWSFSFSISPSNEYIQDWFPLGWTGWISLPSKGLSRVFSNTTVQKPQFFGAQLSL